MSYAAQTKASGPAIHTWPYSGHPTEAAHYTYSAANVNALLSQLSELPSEPLDGTGKIGLVRFF